MIKQLCGRHRWRALWTVGWFVLFPGPDNNVHDHDRTLELPQLWLSVLIHRACSVSSRHVICVDPCPLLCLLSSGFTLTDEALLVLISFSISKSASPLRECSWWADGRPSIRVYKPLKRLSLSGDSFIFVVNKILSQEMNSLTVFEPLRKF